MSDRQAVRVPAAAPSGTAPVSPDGALLITEIDDYLRALPGHPVGRPRRGWAPFIPEA